MVTPLKYFSRDPNGLGRGGGVYYHRGHGVYAKYSIQRDYNVHAKGFDVDRVGTPRKSRFLQITDGKIRR